MSAGLVGWVEGGSDDGHGDSSSGGCGRGGEEVMSSENEDGDCEEGGKEWRS